MKQPDMAPCGGPRRRCSVVANDRRVFAAELHDHRRNRLGAFGDDFLSVLHRAGKDDELYAAADERGAGLTVALNDGNEVPRKSARFERLIENLFETRRRPGDLLGNFHHHCISGKQRRNRRAENVLHRVVPRRDDADDAERSEVDACLFVHEQARRNALGAQVFFAVLDCPAKLFRDRPNLAHHRVLFGLAAASRTTQSTSSSALSIK